MVDKTKDSRYEFYMKKDLLYMFHGVREYIIDKISLGVGLPLELYCRKISPYTGKPETEEMFIKTSPIVSIEL